MKKPIRFIDARTRRTIALLIISIYLVMALTAAFYPVFNKESGDMKNFADYFSKISGGLPTIIGVIIGYYFAKNEDKGTNENGGDSSRVPEAVVPPTVEAGPSPTSIQNT